MHPGPPAVHAHSTVDRPGFLRPVSISDRDWSRTHYPRPLLFYPGTLGTHHPTWLKLNVMIPYLTQIFSCKAFGCIDNGGTGRSCCGLTYTVWESLSWPLEPLGESIKKRIKAPASKSGDLSSIPATHVVGGESRPLCPDPHMCTVAQPPPPKQQVIRILKIKGTSHIFHCFV